MNTRSSRQRRARYLWSALAPTIVLVWGGAAAALPLGGVVAGANGVVAPTIGPAVGSSLNVNTHDSTRTVINWNSFNILGGEAVSFTQPGTSSIAFNVIPAGVQTTISGSLSSNGGVWVMSPGGVIFGAGAVVNTGSFLASTGNFTATSQAEALASTASGSMIEIFPQSTVGVGSISVASTASITANAGFVALHAPNIIQDGTITATDAVVLNAMEGMQVTIDPGANGVLLQGEVPTAPNGGSSNIVEAGPVSAGWIELDAFNDNTTTPGVSGIINLTGHLTATGLKPGGNDSVDLTANFGAASPSALVTTLNAGPSQITSAGNIEVSAGTVSTGTWTAANGLIAVSAGPGGIQDGQPLETQGFSDVDLTATGPLAVTAPITSGAQVNLNADTVSLDAGVAITSNTSTFINAPDGFVADPTSSISAGDNASNYEGVDIEVGSNAGPANLVAGQISASFVQLRTTAALTQPAGGVSSGPGDITIGAAVTALTTNPGNNSPFLNIDAYHSIVINAPVTAQGVTQASLTYNDGGSNGDYSFGANGSLSFTGTPNSGQSLSIGNGPFNQAGYTLLYSPTDLLSIDANSGGNGDGGSYALANSIDLANVANPANPQTPQAVLFTASPIANTSSLDGNVDFQFSGTFAGLGHTIANLNINQTIGGTGATSNGEVGLFGLIGNGGVVRDLNLVNPQVAGIDGMDVGAVAGYIDGTVENVTVTGGQITGGAGFGFNGFGGLVGVVNSGGLVINSHSSANVTGGQGAWVGGLAGALSGGGAIQSSYATGAVSTGDSGAAGGLVGGTYVSFASFLPVNTVTNAYATGTVHGGPNSQIGGFIGEVIQTTITNGYATGAVTQDASTGGQDEAGGFAGFVGDGGVINESYASGSVASTGSAGETNAVGGFVGMLTNSGAISDSYALGAATSDTDSFVGGFAGILSATLGAPGVPSIQRVYATGAVTDTGVAGQSGGLVGQLSLVAGQPAQPSISNSFWDSGTTGAGVAVGQNTVGPQTNLTAVTSATAYLSATYAPTFGLTGANSTWVIFNGQTRPLLRSEYSTSIANAHQLELMSLAPGASYTLASDFDASETSSAAGVWNQANKFVPVGATAAAPFTGAFDGQGHTISNLAVLGTSGVTQSWGAQSTLGAAGLFGFEGPAGAVRNVTLANVNVQGGAGMDVGGLIGVAQGAVNNASTSGLVVTGSDSTSTTPAVAGGLVGGANGQINGSSSSATVNGSNAYVGGLAGWLAPGGSVSTSMASGTVGVGLGGTLNSAAGGLIGFAGSAFVSSTAATVNLSSATGAVTATGGADAGGLIGEIDHANVTSSFATGSVDPAGSAGSVVGGLVGDILNGQISASFATGTVTVAAASAGSSGSAAGGFAGIIDTGGVVTNSYSTGAVSGQPGASSALTTQLGGFVGLISFGGSAVNDYAQSDVTMALLAGAPGFANTGGFAGEVNGSASNMLVSGRVQSGAGFSGGLVGTLGATGVLSIGFWDAGVSPGFASFGALVAGGTDSGLGSVGGAGPSPYLAASYSGFDFNNTWYLISGETRPILRGLYSTTITEAYQLELMSLNPTASYTLATNINASETTLAKGAWNPANGFVPVGGSPTTPFTGAFDGAGHTISNLTITAAAGSAQALPDGDFTFGAAGLFGFASGAISNVTLANAEVTAGNGMAAGALVGNLLSGSITSATSTDGAVTVGHDLNSGGLEEATAGGLVGASSGALNQTSALVTVSALVSSAGEAQVGGLVGEMQGGSILNSHATVQVSVGNTANVEPFGAGGLVGIAEGTAPSITGSYATGAVSGGNGAAIGGFIGIGQNAAITTSYATGAVTETGSSATVVADDVGGFAGILESDSQVSQSFASGAVSSTVSNNEFTEVGGFVGLVSGSGTLVSDAYAAGSVTAPNLPTSQDVGGFAGFQVAGTIKRVLATGPVSPTTGNVGGLIGLEDGGVLTDSYWDSSAAATNQPNAAGTDIFSGVTFDTDVASNAFAQTSYPALDFSTPIWSTPSAGEYPQLYGVSHVLRATAEDTAAIYADFPVYTVDLFGFQPLEGASLVHLLSAGVDPASLSFSQSGHYFVTQGAPYPIIFSGNANATSPDGSGAYRFILADGNLTVTPRPLEASLVNVDKTYDSTTDATLGPGNFQLNGNFQPKGIIGNDDVSIDSTPSSGAYDSPNAGTGIGVTVNGVVTLAGNDSPNYTIDPATYHQFVGEIDAEPLELSAVTDTKTYDGTTSSVGVPVLVNGIIYGDDSVSATQSFDSKNAGPLNARTLSVDQLSVVINDGNNGNNYVVTQFDDAQGTINPAPLTLSAVTDTKVYDGTVVSTATPTESGLFAAQGDTLSTFDQVFDSKNAGPVGARTLSIDPALVINDGNGGANYTVTFNTAPGTITPAPLALDAVTATKVYDGGVSSSTTPTIVGLQTGDSVSSLIQAFAGKNAGAELLSVGAGFVINDGNNGANYQTPILNTAPGTITPAPLSLDAVTATKVYDGGVSSGTTPTIVGLQSGDSVSSLIQTYAGKNAGGELLSVGTGFVINDGNNGANYQTPTLNTAPGTITRAPLTLAAITDTKTYDGTIASSAVPTTPGLVSGDTVTGLSEAFDSRNAGARTLSVVAGFVVNDGAGGANYTISTTTASGTINQAALDINAVGDSKVYDSTTSSSLTPTTAGLVAGDSVTGLTQSFDSKNVGSRTLDVGGGFVVNDGVGGANYSVTVSDADGSITQAPLELSAVTDSKIYDGGTSSTGAPFVVGGLQGNDSVTSLSQVFDSKNAGARTLSIDGFTVNDGNAGGNYSVILDDASGTITPAPLTLGAVRDVRVYNGTTASTATPTETGLIGGDTLSSFFQTFDSKNAGARTLSVDPSVVINDGNGGANYTPSFSSARGTITPAPLTLAATADTKTYDGTTSASVAPSTPGLFAGDTVTGLVETFDSRNAGARILSVGAGFAVNDGAGGANYTISTTTAAGTITRAPLDIDAVGDTKVYDTTTSSGLTPTTAGLVSGDSVTGLTQSFDSKNAGARILTVGAGFVVNDGAGGNNYAVTVADADGTITPAPLTLSAVTDSKVYDGGTASSGTPFVVGGLLGNDTVSGLGQVFDSKNAGARTLSVDAFTIGDGNAGGNYAVTLDTAAGTITPAPLTLAAVADNRVYNATTSSTATPTETGLVGGDTLSSFFQLFDSKNAGARTLLVNPGYGINDGAGGANYAVTLTSARGTITPAPLSVDAVTSTKTYDGTTASSATPTTPGLFAGDTVTGLVESFASRNAGARILSVGPGFVVNDGNGGANYTIATATATGLINPAPLDISAVTDTKVYDSTTTATATPTTTGLVAGDTVSGLFESFDSKNAGDRVLSFNPGFTINDGAGGANYVVSTTFTATGTITPAPLVLGAVTDSKVYDGGTSSTGTPFVVGGLFGGDSVSALTQAFDSKNAGARTLLVNGFTVSDGNGGANYAVTVESAPGTITPAPLTVSAVPDSKVYDATINSTATPTVVGGLFGTDSVSGLSQVFDSKDVGERTLLINPSFTVNDGNNGHNYALILDTASGTITPRPINVDLIGNVFKVYDGNTQATLKPSNYALSGVLPGDSVSFSPVLSGTYDTPLQGTGKTVTVNGLTLTGSDAFDYALPASSSGPIGTICLAGCVLPPVFEHLIDVPLFPLQFGFLINFPLGGDFPVAPDDDSSPKGDVFPVTGAGNRDLWTWSLPGEDTDPDHDKDKDKHP